MYDPHDYPARIATVQRNLNAAYEREDWPAVERLETQLDKLTDLASLAEK